MVVRISRTLVAAGLAGLCLLIAGCLEEKDTLTVYPNGSGTIRLHQKLGAQISNMMLSGKDDDKSRTETMEQTLYKDLGQWQGVGAWTNCEARMKDGCIVLDALGYFDDVSKLQKVEGKNVSSFSLGKNDAGGFEFSWTNLNESEDQPLDAPDDPQMTRQLLDSAKGLRVEHEIVMPGVIASAIGCTGHNGRSASTVFTDEDLARLFAMIGDYRQRVAKNEMTKDKANAEIKEKRRAWSMNMQITSAPGRVDDEFAQFQKEYASARADFAASDVGRKIEAAMAAK